MSKQLPDNLTNIKLFANDRRAVILTDNDTVFRYISAQYKEETQALFESGLIDSLVEKRLLQPGTIRETGITEYPLAIEHPFIHRMSYPFEWSALTLKTAALVILEIEDIVNGYGYTLADPGPYNITILNSNPVYLDYDSIVPMEDEPIWNGYDGFRDVILFPLQLYEKKLSYVARSILRDVGRNDPDQNTRRLAADKFKRGMLDRLVLKIKRRKENTSSNFLIKFIIAYINRILNNRVLRSVLEGANSAVRPTAQENAISDNLKDSSTQTLKALGSRTEFLKRVRKDVESLKVSDYESTGSRKDITDKPWQSPAESWTARENSVYEIVSKTNPKTALVIGLDIGWDTLMLAHNGVSVISICQEEEAVSELYYYVHKEHIDVLPLIMDIRQPTPEYEVNIGTVLAATTRCRSEFVFVPGISNPTDSSKDVSVGKHTVRLNHLTHWLDLFSEKCLLLEFIPLGGAVGAPAKIWKEDTLKDAFSETFKFIESRDSHPKGCKFILFEKRI